MTSKEDVNEQLRTVFDDDFIALWWDLKLPGLGNVSPRTVWQRNPEEVLEYAKGYNVTSE